MATACVVGKIALEGGVWPPVGQSFNKIIVLKFYVSYVTIVHY